MARAGKRYPLVIYTRMMDRWWPVLFFLGIALLGLAWPFYSDLYTQITEPWRWMTLAGLGVFVIFVSLIMLLLRKGAYVQPFGDHLRIATPIFRLNISYKRIRRVSTANISNIFPPKNVRGMRREIIEPLAAMTAVIVELNGYPMSQSALSFFLSPFFFKDKTPHFVLLVQNWMGLSTELDSLRVAGNDFVQQRREDHSILSNLPKR